MKHTILLLAFISGFSIHNSIAQRAGAGGGGSMSSYSSGASAAPSRDVSFSGSSATSGNTTRSETPSQPTQETRSYSAPAVSSSYSPSQSRSANAPVYNNAVGSSAYMLGNNSARNGHTVVYNINGAMRYNYASKRSYAYYPSVHKHQPGKYRSDGHHLLTPERRRPVFYAAYDPVLFLCDYIIDNLPDNGPLPAGTNALNLSLDGYMVYGNDTLSGIVTLTNDSIFLEQPVDAKREYGYRAAYADSDLKTIVAYNGDKELRLTRISANDTKLSRIIHSGKLNIYDDRPYSFLSLNNVDKSKITVAYSGHVETPGSYLTMDAKQLLIRSVNAVYGLKLKSRNFTWDKLLLYIDTLN